MGHQSQSASALTKKVGSPGEPKDRSRKPSDLLARLQIISDAVIRIAVTFKCTAEAFVEELEGVKKDWTRCFNFAPTECDDIIIKAYHGPELIAVFDSNSCITIWSFPVWLWDTMAPLSGFQRIGIIRPRNLALAASGTQTDPAVPDCSSDMIVGEASLSLQPSKPEKLPPIQDTVLEGRTGEDDPHLESTKPPSVTSTEAKATSKLLTRNLPEQPVQRDTDNPRQRRNRYLLIISYKKKHKSSSSELSNAPLSSSSPFPNHSRTSTFEKPPALYLSQNLPSLTDLMHDPSEKRMALMNQRLKPSKKIKNILGELQFSVEFREHARGIPSTI